jgi:hypothetical protein
LLGKRIDKVVVSVFAAVAVVSVMIISVMNVPVMHVGR